MSRVGPAGQHLDAGRRPVVEPHDRLVLQGQPVGGEGLAQRGEHRGVVDHPGPHAGPVVDAPVLAAVLRRVQRDVGVPEQVGAGLLGPPPGDADAGARGERMPGDLDRPGQGGGDPPDVLVQVESVLKEQGELVAAEPGDQAAVRQRLPQQSGHGDQEAVTDVVAEAVVDSLEVVEVDEEHRGGVVEPAGEQRPVGGTGERVGVGQFPEPAFQDPPLGDVEHRAGEPGHGPVVVGEDALVERDVVQRAVGVDHRRVVDLLAARLEQGAVGRGVDVRLFPGPDVVHGSPDDPLAADADVRLERRVARSVDTVGVLAEDRRGDVVDRGLQLVGGAGRLPGAVFGEEHLGRTVVSGCS